MRTASAAARCRNKCSLSSRDVKSTGVKFLVVILPSTVMAKVAATNGRRCRGSRWLPFFFDGTLAASSTGSLRLPDFMLQPGHFLFHIAQFDRSRGHTGAIKEVNNRPWCGTGQHNKEAQRSDKHGYRFRHVTQAMQHDLQ